MESDVRIERGPSGRHLAVSRRIDAPPNSLWEILTDTVYWPTWGPSVVAVDCADRVIRTGSTGRIETALGVWLPFEITSCTSFRWTWNVASVPATGHRVEPLDSAGRVVFELPLLAAGYVPVCQRALGAIDRLATDEHSDARTV